MLASFSVAPVGVGESLSKYVAKIISLIDESGLPYRMGAMNTTVEGTQEEVISLIMDCHNLMKDAAGRVLTSITIDDRKGATGRLTGKIDDVEKIIGRDISRE
ncbi:MAG TPA: MTH1187 family thiamine-binding protein [Candidatus Krumholzibacteriaceae bacterium]|nr:MTH1187 family thiamine-binding protein [Candidatus Krumholzibacteriaceae bacterium]